MLNLQKLAEINNSAPPIKILSKLFKNTKSTVKIGDTNIDIPLGKTIVNDDFCYVGNGFKSNDWTWMDAINSNTAKLSEEIKILKNSLKTKSNINHNHTNIKNSSFSRFEKLGISIIN